MPSTVASASTTGAIWSSPPRRGRESRFGCRSRISDSDVEIPYSIMKRPFVFPLLTAVILVMELAAWPAPGAGAADAVQAGWWTSSPVPAPDAPSGGLEIQGGPDAHTPVAFRAVSFAPADRATPHSP